MMGKKKAFFSYVFWLVISITLVMILTYAFSNLNLKNTAKLTQNAETKIEKYDIPMFQIKDVSYEEYGSTASLSFTLINLGNGIKTRGWILEFLTPQYQPICRATIFTGDPTESGRIFTEIYIPSRNTTISDVDQPIFSGETAEVNIQLISTCLNETINYARSNNKMIVRLTIGPYSSASILQCTVDPTTGYAACSEK